MTGLLYSFDTSAFIKGRRDLLPPEVFPTFWTNIEQMIAAGTIRSVDEVRRELSKRDDTTKAWAMSQDGLFVDLEEDIQAATMSVLAAHSKLTGMGGGRNEADPFVIGFAQAWNRGHRGDPEQQPQQATDPGRLWRARDPLHQPCAVRSRPRLEVLTSQAHPTHSGFWPPQTG